MALSMLVADDSSTIQKVLKIALSKYSVQIAEASSLIEAFSEIARGKFNLLIVDASLPGAKSAQDFQKMRASAGNVPMLLLVGSYESVDEKAFRDVGLEGFVKKPFESKDIIERVDQLLGGGLRKAGASRPSMLTNESKASEQAKVSRGASQPMKPPVPPDGDPMAEDGRRRQGLAAPGDSDDHAVPPPPVAAPAAQGLGGDAQPKQGSEGLSPLTDHSRKGRPAFHDDDDDFEPSDVLPLPLDEEDQEIEFRPKRPSDAARKPAEPQTRHATTTYIPPSVGLDEWDEMQRQRRAEAKPDQFEMEPTESLEVPPPEPVEERAPSQSRDNLVAERAPATRTTIDSPFREPILDAPSERFAPHESALRDEHGLDEDRVMKMLELIVAEKIVPLVIQAVETYCEEHFPDVARETLTEEIRRLADEKARHLVDN